MKARVVVVERMVHGEPTLLEVEGDCRRWQGCFSLLRSTENQWTAFPVEGGYQVARLLVTGWEFAPIMGPTAEGLQSIINRMNSYTEYTGEQK